MISKETIERIRDTARVEEVVGEFVNLKRRGTNLLGLCPFHSEKTPSFTVSPAKGIYKCFGCGASGDAVKFIMEHEHYSYPDALKYLAKKYNIEIEEILVTPEYQEEQNLKESLYAVNQFAEQFFIDQLWKDPKGQAIGLSYFHERGFSDEIIKKFRLGYAQDDWTHFTMAAQQHGYKLEYLKAVGLTSSGEKNVDVYRGRVMFPIHNITGRVLGFGGRTLKVDKSTPKYINSPESEIYNKSKILYGLFFAKSAIIKEDNCYLVEGYTDVISLHQAGIENVVASSGTSLTEGQIQLIKRYTSNITILYDGDTAGIKASFRGIDMILEAGMNVHVVLFPDGEDPDSFSRKVQHNELINFLNTNRKDFIRFKADVLLHEAGTDPIKRAGVVRDMVESIALIPDGIVRNMFIQQCASIMNIPEQTLFNELNKLRRNKLKEKHKKEGIVPADWDVMQTEPIKIAQPIQLELNTHAQEREIIRLLLNYGYHDLVYHEKNEDGDTIEFREKVYEMIIDELSMDEINFTHPIYQNIYSEFQNFCNHTHSQEAIQQFFIRHDNDEVRNLAIELIIPQYTMSKNWEERLHVFTVPEEEKLHASVVEALHQLRLRHINLMIDDEKKKLKNATDAEEIFSIMEVIKNLEVMKKKLSEELTTVIHPL
ncbi:MAG: DNA primase [Flavobacteriales bacterium]|nr:DNA primase [Flavobacteriales bacterium]